MCGGLTTKSRGLKFATVGVLVAGVTAAALLAGPGNQEEVEAASTRANRHAKNVIVMISDGWGYNHIKATDYYGGGKQAYESFPVRFAMSTYEYENTDAKLDGSKLSLLGYDPVLTWDQFDYTAFPLATDSASAATAMATGVKTKNGSINVDVAGNSLKTVTERAEELGKSTGVITTVEWSHATPAGFVAHNANRNNYDQIAQEMIQSSETDVIMGAGNPYFDDNGDPLAIPGTFKYVGGSALWDQLVAGTAGGDVDGDGINDPWTLIQTRAEFQALGHGSTPERVCGTFQAATTTQQARSGNDGDVNVKDDVPYEAPLNDGVPTLTEMTKAAINVLDDNRKGFFLMIEGGAVDWASHANQTGRMIEEQQDYNQAVNAVIAWVNKNSNWNDTLLIVTGDHETGALWGPGAGSGSCVFPSVQNNGAGNLPGVSWNSPEHTNALIPLYAKGETAKLFNLYAKGRDLVRGAYIDNTSIADVVFSAMK